MNISKLDSANNIYLGQLVPAPLNQGLSPEASSEIKGLLGKPEKIIVHLHVASTNDLKAQAAEVAVAAWAGAVFKGCAFDIQVKRYDTPSGVDEQPHGENITRSGVTNRLQNLKAELLDKEKVNSETNDQILRILFAFENGLIQEKLAKVKNPDTFLNKDGTVWVDRCFVKGEVWFQGKKWDLSAISEGVTTPQKEVEQAEATGWTKTAGSFIATAYGCNAKDWHGKIAGKKREPIMMESARAAFGIKDA